jgi:uncharacterized membrane protein
MQSEKLELKSFYHYLNVILLIIIAGMVFIYWKDLPDKIPIHFNFSGTPDGWAGKENLIIIFAVVLGLNALLYFFMISTSWLSNHPSIWNIPNKKRFLALPKEKQQLYWELTKEFMAGMASAINILWTTLMWGTIQVCLKKMNKLPEWAIFPGLVVILIVILMYIPRLIRMPKKLIEEQV